MARADVGAIERFDDAERGERTRDRRRSCRRSGPNRCASRRGSAAATARCPRVSRRCCRPDRCAARSPRRASGRCTYRRPATSASEKATRLTPSANVPPAGRPNALRASRRSRKADRIDARALPRSAGHAHRPGAGRHGAGLDELAAGHSHGRESTAAQVLMGLTLGHRSNLRPLPAGEAPLA